MSTIELVIERSDDGEFVGTMPECDLVVTAPTIEELRDRARRAYRAATSVPEFVAVETLEVEE
ncbi:MAG: hypothetical protein WEG36_12355 [Gemmatimonadota bacterium]